MADPLQAPQNPPPAPPRRYVPRNPLLAASAAGVIEILLTFPLEFVKTQLQLQQTNPDAPGGRAFRSAWHCATVTWGRHGWRGFYSGIEPWLAFAVPRNAVRFGTFEHASTLLGKLRVDPNAAPALAGLVAGTLEAALVITPMQSIQVKMIHDSNAPHPQFVGSFARACWMIPRHDGVVGGLFSGLTATVVKGATTNCIRFGAYSLLSTWAMQRTSKNHLSPLLSAGCGAVAGGLSVVVSHPVDVVKSNMQRLHAQHHYRHSWDCARQIVTSAGVGGLFHGLAPRAARVCCEIGLLFSLYEQIGRLLE